MLRVRGNTNLATEGRPQMLDEPDERWALIGCNEYEIKESVREDRLVWPAKLTLRAGRRVEALADQVTKSLFFGSNRDISQAMRDIAMLRNWIVWQAAGLVPVDRERDINTSRLHVMGVPSRVKDIVGKALNGRPLRRGNLAFARWIMVGANWGFISSTYLERKFSDMMDNGPHVSLKYPKNEPGAVAVLEQDILAFVFTEGILPDGTQEPVTEEVKRGLHPEDEHSYPPTQLQSYLWRQPSWGTHHEEPVCNDGVEDTLESDDADFEDARSDDGDSDGESLNDEPGLPIGSTATPLLKSNNPNKLAHDDSQDAEIPRSASTLHPTKTPTATQKDSNLKASTFKLFPRRYTFGKFGHPRPLTSDFAFPKNKGRFKHLVKRDSRAPKNNLANNVWTDAPNVAQEWREYADRIKTQHQNLKDEHNIHEDQLKDPSQPLQQVATDLEWARMHTALEAVKSGMATPLKLVRDGFSYANRATGTTKRPERKFSRWISPSSAEKCNEPC